MKDAHKTIEDAQIIRLSVDDQPWFADMLLNPPELAPTMQKALHGQKPGSALLADAAPRALRSEVAVFALVVDAKDDAAQT